MTSRHPFPAASDRSPPSTGSGFDPVRIGCNLFFALLLLIPAGGLVLAVLVLVASVPLVVALFPMAITLGGLWLAILYARHRRARHSREGRSLTQDRMR